MDSQIPLTCRELCWSLVRHVMSNSIQPCLMFTCCREEDQRFKRSRLAQTRAEAESRAAAKAVENERNLKEKHRQDLAKARWTKITSFSFQLVFGGRYTKQILRTRNIMKSVVTTTLEELSLDSHKKFQGKLTWECDPCYGSDPQIPLRSGCKVLASFSKILGQT